MNKAWMVTGLGMVVAAGVAGAGTLEGMVRWAERTGPDGVERTFAQLRVSDPADMAVITQSWHEAGTVALALDKGYYRLLDWIGRYDTFSGESEAKIRDGILADSEAPACALGVARLLPLEMRMELEPALLALVDRHYADTPVFGRHLLKYGVMRFEHQRFLRHTVTHFPSLVGPNVETRDLLELLMAPEAMTMGQVEATKRAISDAAVPLARAALRASGESFVVRDGVNPLTEAVRPVVEALNAPGLAGIESALRGLGVEVEDFDRQPLAALAAGWEAEIMSGEKTGSDAGAVLGKLTVALGVEGFNAFVDAYNHGTAAAGGDGHADAR